MASFSVTSSLSIEDHHKEELLGRALKGGQLRCDRNEANSARSMRRVACGGRRLRHHEIALVAEATIDKRHSEQNRGWLGLHTYIDSWMDLSNDRDTNSSAFQAHGVVMPTSTREVAVKVWDCPYV
eukprot:CAMPEP_0206419788 /NCGR_PEP_ID=MMETSP0324_2-20121206/392_1 /ASSEMBLY_ACC=CAM_ASM_000836 /TAXON_ID=2866 /ORGANISM="Crypthecodinium cohnii, Strain Seligo" /LENGTH=125 /DNA_ID=CAMNT_0053883421 /DNA_START=86 /DNA_END=459 /DNA_ORIENTATION=-